MFQKKHIKLSILLTDSFMSWPVLHLTILPTIFLLLTPAIKYSLKNPTLIEIFFIFERGELPDSKSHAKKGPAKPPPFNFK